MNFWQLIDKHESRRRTESGPWSTGISRFKFETSHQDIWDRQPWQVPQMVRYASLETYRQTGISMGNRNESSPQPSSSPIGMQGSGTSPLRHLGKARKQASFLDCWMHLAWWRPVFVMLLMVDGGVARRSASQARNVLASRRLVTLKRANVELSTWYTSSPSCGIWRKNSSQTDDVSPKGKSLQVSLKEHPKLMKGGWLLHGKTTRVSRKCSQFRGCDLAVRAFGSYVGSPQMELGAPSEC